MQGAGWSSVRDNKAYILQVAVKVLQARVRDSQLEQKVSKVMVLRWNNQTCAFSDADTAVAAFSASATKLQFGRASTMRMYCRCLVLPQISAATCLLLAHG